MTDRRRPTQARISRGINPKPLLFTAVSSAVLVSCAQSKPVDPQQAEQEIRIWLSGYADAINSGDIDKAGSYYSDGAGFYWIERGGLQYESAEAARTSLSSLAKSGLNIDVKYTETHISLLGPDAAIASLKFETTFRHADGGSFGFNGWQTTGVVRTDNGWKIAGGHTETLPPSD